MKLKWQGKPVTWEQEQRYRRQKRSIAAMYERLRNGKTHN